MAKETNQEARLRLFLAEYERVCKRYSLYVWGTPASVCERTDSHGIDDLPTHIWCLKEGGIHV